MSLSGLEFMGLVGQTVKVNRGGPDSVEGVLLSAQNSYLAVWSKDKKIVYISTQHIKSITASQGSQGSRSGGAQSGSKGSRSGGASYMGRPIHAYSFAGLLQSLQYRHVQINRGGPEKLEGVIINTNQNYLMLAVKGEEVVRIPIFHIKSVTVVGSSSNNNGSKGNSSNGSKGNNQSGGNKSGGKQSGGNRSGENRTGGNRSGGSYDWGSQSWGNRSKNRSKRNSSGRRSGGRRTAGYRSGGRNGGRSGGRSGGRR
ncbi:MULTISPECIES: hypothetical protein [Paenibacillus]|uniref:Spore coat protein B n=1 Tax=Paenibacillus albilobatus TaxID=2716884 RepID=A0A919XIT6_9BACL|nr:MULTISPECIES: hypothetical protein [Paenibacillus]GIO32519.1 hypothetical protein J2TS6_36600 [Paenibacillus albilobatus]